MSSIPSSQGEQKASKDGLLHKNLIYNMIKTLSSIAFPLITFPYVARILEAENLGKVNFASSVVSYFSLIASLGITAYAVRTCSQVKTNREELGRVSGQILSINLVTTTLSYTLLFFTLFFSDSLKPYAGLIFVLSSSILFTTLGADWLNTVMEDFRFITLRTFAFQFVSLILMFVFVHSSDDYYAYAIISVIASSGAGIVNILYRKKYCKVHFTLNIDWKKHLPPILWLFVMILSQTLLNNIDTTMIGILKNDVSVGQYSTAVKLITVITQVVSSIAWVMMPQLSRGFAQKDYCTLNKLLGQSINLTIMLGLPCVAGIILFSEDLIMIIGGPTYLGAATCMRILAVAMLLNFLNGFYGNFILLPSCRERQFMIACLLGSLVNIIGNMLLIPYHGVNGAAIMTMVSAAIILLVCMRDMDKNLILPSISETWKSPVVGTMLLIALGLLVKQTTDIAVIRIAIFFAMGTILYFGTLIAFGNSSLKAMLKRNVRN